MSGYDIGVSLADSTAQQSARDIRFGDFIVGGSGGANKIPWWAVVGLVVAFVVIGGFILLLQPKRR